MKNFSEILSSSVEVPNLGYLPIRRGTFKVRNIRQIYIYISFNSKYLYINQLILFKKNVICLL